LRSDWPFMSIMPPIIQFIQSSQLKNLQFRKHCLQRILSYIGTIDSLDTIHQKTDRRI
jgi:hypothetical protein